jgi:hypothetical protein
VSVTFPRCFISFPRGSNPHNETGKYYRTWAPDSLKDFDLSHGEPLRVLYVAGTVLSLLPSKNREFVTKQEIIGRLASDELDALR